MGFSKATEEFLWDLSFNNERPWFLTNKERFEEVLNSPFKDLAMKTITEMDKRFPDAKLDVHVSRIYKDARRLHGGPPYKDHLWFSIKNRTNGYNGAQFFFELNPREAIYGLGFWASSVDEMNEFRKSVDANLPRFTRLAEDVSRMENFQIGGEKYKKLKADYGDVVNEWYNRKNVHVSRSLDYGDTLFSPELYLEVADDFEKLMPMYGYLNQFCRDYV